MALKIWQNYQDLLFFLLSMLSDLLWLGQESTNFIYNFSEMSIRPLN